MLRNIVIIIFSLNSIVACSNTYSATDYSEYYSYFSYTDNSSNATLSDDYEPSQSTWEDSEEYQLLLEEESEYEEEMF